VKRHLPGLLAALLLAWFFPASENLSTAWSRAWSVGTVAAATVSPVDERFAFGSLLERTSTSADSIPVSDPFRSEAPPPSAAATGSRSDLGVPPPPRPWKVTGRVGERAAVLTNPDGRVLVVSNGAMVDSSRVISIGTTGIVLEDRAGQFTLKIP
jgi:hypothetical protein